MQCTCHQVFHAFPVKFLINSGEKTLRSIISDQNNYLMCEFVTGIKCLWLWEWKTLPYWLKGKNDELQILSANLFSMSFRNQTNITTINKKSRILYFRNRFLWYLFFSSSFSLVKFYKWIQQVKYNFYTLFYIYVIWIRNTEMDSKIIFFFSSSHKMCLKMVVLLMV